MSSLISKKSSTGYGMQPYGPPCGSTILMQIYFAPLSNFKARLQVQFRLTAAQENGSEQQLMLGKDALSHPPSSTFFSNWIMTDALEEHDGKVSIGGRNINTGWERTVHVSRCPALYSGRIFVPLCRELIIFVF